VVLAKDAAVFSLASSSNCAALNPQWDLLFTDDVLLQMADFRLFEAKLNSYLQRVAICGSGRICFESASSLFINKASLESGSPDTRRVLGP
jgi:hypothetical protein